MIEHVQLGKSEILIPRICLGGWQVAGWKTCDERSFTKVVHTALDLGINFVDTAEAYGKGYSEEIIGKALQGVRHKTIVATKFSHTRCTPEQIKQALNSSLRALRTDYIDLYQYHWPHPKADLNDVIGTMEQLKKEGKIRAIGVSNWMEPEWSEFDRPERIDSLQPCYNLLWRSIEKNVLPICTRHNISVLPYSPLAQGILAGRFLTLEQIPKDPRASNVLLKPDRFDKVRPVLEALAETSRATGKTLAQISLRWLLQRPGVTAPIVGASSPAQILDSSRIFDWQLTGEQMEQLNRISAPLIEDLNPHDTLWNWHPRAT